MQENLVALPLAAEEIRKKTGKSVGYRKLYEAILDGKIPSIRVNGRHHIDAKTLVKVPSLLGLTARAA